MPPATQESKTLTLTIKPKRKESFYSRRFLFERAAMEKPYRKYHYPIPSNKQFRDSTSPLSIQDELTRRNNKQGDCRQQMQATVQTRAW